MERVSPHLKTNIDIRKLSCFFKGEIHNNLKSLEFSSIALVMGKFSRDFHMTQVVALLVLVAILVVVAGPMLGEMVKDLQVGGC